eukprot:TRINITY_DN343_c0_g1_i1.p1 TRINITY_DN343_c0_g1~~TRINITY_DN343_c0_g1_i1.p1  ORF type:complete len:654 (-),score=116.63 TRINITY_DN343_c0_g1_i1:787-2748(-)
MMRFKPKKSAQEAPINAELPDECLALIFGALQSPKDRVNCSLVCTRWLWLVASIPRPRVELDQEKTTIAVHRPRPDKSNQCKLSGKKVSDRKLALSAVIYGPKLRKLDLHDLSFDRGISALGLEALSTQCPLLDSLTLSHSKDLSSQWLCMMAQRCSRLLNIQIKACPRISDPGIVAVMTRCQHMKQLHVSRCRRVTGAGWLFGKNAAWKELTKLRLEDCKCLGDIPGLATSVSGVGISTRSSMLHEGANVTPGDESDGSAASEKEALGCVRSPTGTSGMPPDAGAVPLLFDVQGGTRTTVLETANGHAFADLRGFPTAAVPALLEKETGQSEGGDSVQVPAPVGLRAELRWDVPMGASLPKLELVEFRELPMFSDLALETLVRQAPVVRHLTMAGNLGCGKEGLERLAGLGRQLTYLCMMSMPVEDAGFSVIIHSCRTFKDIKLKDLQNLTEKGIGEILVNCPALKRLRVSKCPRILDAKLKPAIIGNGNHLLNTVRSLGFKDMPGVGDLSLQAIGSVCPSLESLSLTRCAKVTDKGLQYIVKRQNGNRLKKLGMKGCMVTDKTLKEVGSCCPLLRNLDVINCAKITKSGLLAISGGCQSLLEVRIPKHFQQQVEQEFIKRNVKVEYSEQDNLSVGPSRSWRNVLCNLFIFA